MAGFEKKPRAGASATRLIAGPRDRHAGGPRRQRRARVAFISAIALIGFMAGGATILTGGRRQTPLRPSAVQISMQMWRTVLVGEPLEHFYPAGEPATTSDGSGGVFSAEVGAILPSTDGDGQLVFFWHNNRFVGWDSPVDSMAVLQLQPLGDRHFVVTYSNYAPNDPACCPSLIPLSVAYRWSGDHFVAEGPLPMYHPIPNRVRLIR